MEYALKGAQWVVSKVLSAVTGGLLEAWAASKNLGADMDALMAELHYAQAMLSSTRGREIDNVALNELLLKLRLPAYDADDVLDELDYFRIQDELEGTYHAADVHAGGCVHGLLLHVNYTTRAVAAKLKPSCFHGKIRGEHEEQDNSSEPSPTKQKINCKFMQKLASITRSSAHGAGNEQVQTVSKLKFDRVGVSKRLTEIVNNLKPICSKVSTILTLELLGCKNMTVATTERTITMEESVEPKIYGREIEQKRLVKLIAQGCASNNIMVVPIVGPGGIGKTTFAQHVYQEVKIQFQVTIWICVGLDFNANRLTQELRKKITPVTGEKENASDQELIQQRLTGKSFLLVLDDVWNCHEVEWGNLLAPFRKAGGKGSVVVVTTRLSDVAEMARTVDCPIQLGGLGAQDFRNFFDACAPTRNELWSQHHELIETGENILKKLKGSPLAAKTVGRVLRKKLDLDHWRKVLQSKTWELEMNENDIMIALKIDYDHLPLNLALCFSHCSLFPEDYEFDSKELINFWTGLGFLSSGDQHIRIEDVGRTYLIDLVNYGFFRKYENDNGQHCYIMHDLLHDLAVQGSRNDCLSVSLSEISYLQVPASVRHISIMVDKKDIEDTVTFKNREKDLSQFSKKLQIEKLHTLMLYGEYLESFSKTLGSLFQQARALRTVFLIQGSYVEDVLHNLSNLVHLRHLRIKGYRYLEMNLPLSRLYQLVIADLENCLGCCIPSKDLSNLIHVQHIPPDHSDIFKVGKMKLLRELRIFKSQERRYWF